MTYRYFVTGIVRGYDKRRKSVGAEVGYVSKREAMQYANHLKHEMKIAIPKYRWIRDIKVKRYAR
jgi:hypothetical protein